MSTAYIKRVEIQKLWGKYDIVWDNLHPDVNILVGINGSGKSTLLKIIYAALAKDDKIISACKFDAAQLEASNSNTYEIESNSKNKKSFSAIGYADEFIANYELISTFDVAISDKKKLGQNESPLTNELKKIILEVGKGTNSFTEYRLRVTQDIEKATEINKQINAFFERIDVFFKYTGKTIAIDYSTNRIIFKSEGNTIEIEELSSGEKQLLLILFKVFLMDQKPFVLLMDEPEISLHLGWQQELINVIRELNPNCQLIISTHSPSIFGKGWGDKITFMDKLFVE